MDSVFEVRLSNLIQRMRGELLTPAGFEDALTLLLGLPESPLTGLTFEVAETAPTPGATYGAPCDDDANWVEVFDDEGGFKVTARGWLVPGTVSIDIRGHALDLFRNFFRPADRDDMTRMLDGGRPGIKEALEASVIGWSRGGAAVSFAFADIDKFSAFNEKHGHVGGDLVLRHLSAAIHKEIPPTVLPIHRSGDEFLLVSPGRPSDAAEMAVAVHHAITSTLRGTPELEAPALTISMGIAVVEAAEIMPGLHDLELRAEKALEPSGKKSKRRNRVTVESSSRLATRQQRWRTLKGREALAAALVASTSVAEPAPFGNRWLNVLSRRAAHLRSSGATAEELKRGIDLVQSTADLKIRSGRSVEALGWPDASQSSGLQVTPVEVAVAVGHGIGRAMLEGGATEDVLLAFDASGAAGSVSVGGETLLSIGTGATPESIPIRVNGASGGLDADGHRALAIQVGYAPMPLPRQLLGQVVIVDDRPSAGGGLPDFWERTVAEVATAVLRNPNIAQIFIIGAVKYARRTIEVLMSADTWQDNIDDFSARTSLRPPEMLARQGSDQHK